MSRPREKKYPLETTIENGKPIIAVGSGAGKLFIEFYFPNATNQIRIASSYFNLRGYEIGERFIRNKEVKYKILVGGHSNNNRSDAKEAQKAILNDIKEELNECNHLWAISIQSLVDKMKSNSFQIMEARETSISPLFHTKFYIIDNELLFHGSANYSSGGLQNNAEQVSVTFAPKIVESFIAWYDKRIVDAYDLKKELLAILEAWLNLSKPFDVYLKMIHFLNEWTDNNDKLNQYQPNYYQKVVIKNAYKQIEEYGGTLIIAATGLGKTIIGSEIAYKLQNDKKSKRVIVLSPPNVHGDWEKQLELRDVHHYVFGISLLFKDDSEKEKDYHKISKLKNKLEEADEFTTIIIDEVHLYKNQKPKEITDDKISSVYERLIPAIGRKAKIILLTATPYSSNILNVESILHLLPHNAPSEDELFEIKKPWNTNDVSLLVNLPVVTIIGLPQVLKLSKERGDIDKLGRVFVEFGGEKRYFPKQIKIVPVQYEIFLGRKIEEKIEQGFFDQRYKKRKNIINDDTAKVVSSLLDVLYNEAITSWLSSPFALKSAILQNINSGEDEILEQTDLFNQTEIEYPELANNDAHGYKKAQLKLSKSERKRNLIPILDWIKTEVKSDDKFLKLKTIVNQRYKLGKSKILIFVERYQTAMYLLDLLKEEYGNKVVSTVEIIGEDGMDNKPSLKEKNKRLDSIKSFSPKSNDYKAKYEYDILICTDADGIGLNLQDCDTIINYDLPETADSLFQRLGRILRMTIDADRIIFFYSLIPDFIETVKAKPETCSEIQINIANKFLRLTKRHGKSKNILGTAIMAENNKEEIIDLSNDSIWKELSEDSGFINLNGNSETESQLSHLAIYERYKSRVNSTLDFIHSCKTYNEKEIRIIVLIMTNDGSQIISYNISDDKLEINKKKVSILNMVSCKADTSTFFRQASEIERHTNHAIALWCLNKKIEIQKVQKICALLLIPQKDIKNMKIIDDFLK